MKNEFALSCPRPLKSGDRVLLAHGGGGKAMGELIDKVFLEAFQDEALARRHDASVLPLGGDRLSFTTDSFVVHPIFFPGGDIGSLSVHGTVNDLAMSGARPLYLSAGFILEEGLPLADLERVVDSMARAAREAGVRVVTGDTKVVDKGKGDGVYINTSGVGVVEHALDIRPSSVRPGDVVIVSGDLGRHGLAVMAVREGLSFESTITSDSASLWPAVKALLDGGIEVHCLRDATRGGLAAGLNEIASAAGVAVRMEETALPVREDVRAACEVLGLDPFYAANEGRFIAFVPAGQAEKAVALLARVPVSSGARLAGRVLEGGASVVLRTAFGVERALDLLSGEQMPRIC